MAPPRSSLARFRAVSDTAGRLPANHRLARAKLFGCCGKHVVNQSEATFLPSDEPRRLWASRRCDHPEWQVDGRFFVSKLCNNCNTGLEIQDDGNRTCFSLSKLCNNCNKYLYGPLEGGNPWRMARTRLSALRHAGATWTRVMLPALHQRACVVGYRSAGSMTRESKADGQIAFAE